MKNYNNIHFLIIIVTTIYCLQGCERIEDKFKFQNLDSIKSNLEGIWEYTTNNDTIKYGFFKTSEGIKKSKQNHFQPFTWKLYIDSLSGNIFIKIDYFLIENKDELSRITLDSESILYLDEKLLTKNSLSIYHEFPEINKDTLKHKIKGCWRGTRFNLSEIPSPHRQIILESTIYIYIDENQGAFIKPMPPGRATFWEMIDNEFSVFPNLRERLLDDQSFLYSGRLLIFNKSLAILKGNEIYEKQDNLHSYTVKNLKPDSLNQYILGKWRPINGYFPLNSDTFSQIKNYTYSFYQNKSGTKSILNGNSKSFNWIVFKSDSTEFPLLKITFIDSSPHEFHKIKSITCDTLLHMNNVLYKFMNE